MCMYMDPLLAEESTVYKHLLVPLDDTPLSIAHVTSTVELAFERLALTSTSDESRRIRTHTPRASLIRRRGVIPSLENTSFK